MMMVENSSRKHLNFFNFISIITPEYLPHHYTHHHHTSSHYLPLLNYLFPTHHTTPYNITFPSHKTTTAYSPQNHHHTTNFVPPPREIVGHIVMW